MGAFSFRERLQNSLCQPLSRFFRVCLCVKNFRSRRPGLGREPDRNSEPQTRFSSSVPKGAGEGRGYSGLRPRASNCRHHSVGGSRSRSTPIPRGRRPSMAALTRLGARKASEMVMLTCRTLHFSRPQSSVTLVTRPETTSSSHRRPLAMALTRRARRSNCCGWTSLRDALCGNRIRRALLESLSLFAAGIRSELFTLVWTRQWSPNCSKRIRSTDLRDAHRPGRVG
jgi:hypothetical protein